MSLRAFLFCSACLCTGLLSRNDTAPGIQCASRRVLQENETVSYGSLAYRPSSASVDMCQRRDWLYTLPSWQSTARGYIVTLQSLYAASYSAGVLSIGAVGGGADARGLVHRFYGFEGQFRDSARYGYGYSSSYIANVSVVARHMNISLRATDYFTFSLTFQPLTGARAAAHL